MIMLIVDSIGVLHFIGGCFFYQSLSVLSQRNRLIRSEKGCGFLEAERITSINLLTANTSSSSSKCCHAGIFNAVYFWAWFSGSYDCEITAVVQIIIIERASFEAWATFIIRKLLLLPVISDDHLALMKIWKFVFGGKFVFVTDGCELLGNLSSVHNFKLHRSSSLGRIFTR